MIGDFKNPNSEIERGEVMKKPEAVFVFISALMLLLSGCTEKEHPASVKRPLITGVTLSRIEPTPVDSFYQTTGTIRAKTVSQVASRSLGTVTSLKFREGDPVKAGQLLLTIEDRDLNQRVTGAEAGYQEALKAQEAADQNRILAAVTYDRYKNLYQQKVITQQEMDQIETQKKVAQSEYDRTSAMVQRSRAALEESRINLGFAQVRAPISGLVTEKKIDEGSLATLGQPLLTIEDSSQLRVEAFVDQQKAGQFKTGDRVTILPDITGEPITGTINEVVQAVDPATRTFLIKILVKGTGLKSGLYCQVLIPDGKKETILLPKKVIVEKGQLEGVFVVDAQGVMTYRLIRTGKTMGDKKEILSGLKGGEQVVISGLERALDGGVIKP
jgi:RND family efflux transporter MFP subunit